ncbi:MAG: hypothetical protein JW839_08975 [Candidatus Lokiarchaeota archaeon]|nr:hypothetical protein [Candidatus Lokiarchaeota archaeon]
MAFKTGLLAFDELNAASGTLMEYIAQDEVQGGKYTTFVLLEKRSKMKHQVLGLCRFRYIHDRNEATTDFKQFGVDKKIIDDLEHLIDNERMNIIYFSRIGVKVDLQDKNVGKIINDFFEFLIKRQEKKTAVYLKIRKEIDDFLGKMYETVGEGDDKKWGKYLVKIKLFF